jgi:anti-sigma-K factor RskA
MADDLHAAHDADDPHWLAERYLLGELDDAAAAAFEERLADDEAAAAALASTVRLLAAVEAARPAVAAAALSAATGTLPAAPGRPVVRPAAERAATIAGRGAAIGVIATATALSALLFLNPAAVRGPAADSAAARSDAPREVALSADGEAEEPPESDDVPEWLLAAVALEADGDGRVREN